MAIAIANQTRTVAAGGTVYAGRGPAVPAWIRDAVPRRWVAIPGNTLADVDPDPGRAAAWAGSGGQPAIITAWGSSWLDPATGIQRFWGGGHTNYSGNEMYGRDLSADTPQFTRISEPSNLADYGHSVGTATTYSDGRLRSSHIYNAFVWVPGVGPVMAGLSSRATDGGHGSSAIFTFNASTGAATASATATNSGGGTGVAACFDDTRGTQGSIWMRRQGSSIIQRHDYAADTRVDVGDLRGWSGQCSLAAHPSGAYLLVGNGDTDQGQTVSGGWCVFDPAGPGGTFYNFPTFSGAVSGGLQPGWCQPVWVPSLGCFCTWDNRSDTTKITTLTPGANPLTDAWTISSLSVDGGNTVTPSTAAAKGTYGRFRYWAAAGALVLLNSASETGYAFKL